MPIITENNLTLIISMVSVSIAISMFGVAYIQTRIQRNNLHLALFDRRFKVYKDSQKLYQEYSHGYISQDTFSNFICSFHASKILFPTQSGVYDFLDKVHQDAVSFNGTKTTMQITDEPKALEILSKHNREACSNLNGFLEELNKLMKPFIKIDY